MANWNRLSGHLFGLTWQTETGCLGICSDWHGKLKPVVWASVRADMANLNRLSRHLLILKRSFWVSVPGDGEIWESDVQAFVWANIWAYLGTDTRYSENKTSRHRYRLEWQTENWWTWKPCQAFCLGFEKVGSWNSRDVCRCCMYSKPTSTFVQQNFWQSPVSAILLSSQRTFKGKFQTNE